MKNICPPPPYTTPNCFKPIFSLSLILPFLLIVSVLLFAHIERVSVSRKGDFPYFKLKEEEQIKMHKTVCTYDQLHLHLTSKYSQLDLNY